jgi:DNA-binding transcriptional LysR family regulator
MKFLRCIGCSFQDESKSDVAIVKISGLLHNWLTVHTRNSKMNNNFDWTLVRSFLAALEHGSLLGAARALQSSQPTLGRHIAELESQLGTTLFERTGRGLLPTAMALKLADSARAMEAGANKIARQASGAQSELAGAVRISASQPVACVLLPPILTRMRLALPEIAVELVVSNAVSNLLKREADIALRMVQPDQGSLVAKRVGRVLLGVYAHTDYLRRRGWPKLPTDLLTHDLIGGDTDTTIFRGFEAMGYTLNPERVVLRSDDFMAQFGATKAGLGIGFLARYLAQTDPQLIPLLPELPIPPLPMWLVVHREIRSSQRIKAVYDFLAGAIPQVLPPPT